MKDIQFLKGIGEARAKLFARAGLRTCEDLLRHYPSGYEDRTLICEVKRLQSGVPACVEATVAERPREARVRGGLLLTKTTAADDSGRLYITFFNSPYIKDTLKAGETYTFYGKPDIKNGRAEMVNPVFETESKKGRTTGRLMPVYRLTKGLTQYAVRSAVEQAMELLVESAAEILPQSVRQKYGLCHAGFALRQIHAPDDAENLAMARRRLAFEELFVLALGLARLKMNRGAKPGVVFKPLEWGEFEDALPFELTGAQRRAILECENDTQNGTVMGRLIQGDVGSGKTMAAAAMCFMAARSGFQSALMAPTELLAAQHYATLGPLMEKWGVSAALLTGRITPAQKAKIQGGINKGEIDFVVGTHALLSKNVEFPRLGLIITDEQHRFGVEQRAALSAKGEGAHTMVMSATPIPRTLALLMYGELDVSVLDELPPGRTPVKTYAVTESYRERIDGFIRKTVDGGGQVFVVCPMIESEDELPPEGVREATAVQARLKKIFPELEIGLAHGKMKPKERQAAMESFSAGDTAVLAATTVIEVGVDVPNANLMIVENAERFGLAQLHQLRGRVGRGKRESYCVLFNGGGGELAAKRLGMLEKSNDGFAIAELDLAIRGPGEFFGTRQHGLPALSVADLNADAPILEEARAAAAELLTSDPGLSGYPELRRRAGELIERLEN